jgi:hypothetical protein
MEKFDVEAYRRKQAERRFREVIPPVKVEGPCPCCGEGETAKRRRNTSYANDALNWLVSCERCWKEDCEHYQELWDIYYADCM